MINEQYIFLNQIFQSRQQINKVVLVHVLKQQKQQIKEIQKFSKSQIQRMQQNNYMLEESHMDGSYQLRLKLKYLQDDKQKLQVSNKEMKQKIHLLRDVNKQLSKSNLLIEQSPIMKLLQQQNVLLQRSYMRVLQQNNALTCRNLMLQQIIQESQNQHIQILKGYQNKIIQLRRSIQFKQSCIQSYEQNANYNGNGYQVGNIPTSNISMIFFNEIDQYKNTIGLLENRINQLQIELTSLKDKNTNIEQQKILIDQLISSRYGYAQFRERLYHHINQGRIKAYSEEKLINRKSNPYYLNKQLTRNNNNTNNNNKSNNNSNSNNKSNDNNKTTQNNNSIKQKSKQTLHSSQPQQTRQISYQCTSGNFKLNQLKDQLKKSNTQLTKLAINYRKQQKKRKQNELKIKILLNSNKFYKQKRQTNTDQLNYFKTTTSDLLRLIQKRKIKRTYSVDKTQVQQMIASIKRPQQIQLLKNNKKYWKKVQNTLNHRIKAKTKIDLETINRTKLRKSISDILDFSSMCHDDDNLHKYYFQKNSLNPNKLNLNNELNSQNKNNLDDFSRILQLGANGDIFDDQTLIIKAKPISYAERKKTKNKSKISNAHNLTIIRENIL